jgi:hypothetical protein
MRTEEFTMHTLASACGKESQIGMVYMKTSVAGVNRKDHADFDNILQVRSPDDEISTGGPTEVGIRHWFGIDAGNALKRQSSSDRGRS